MTALQLAVRTDQDWFAALVAIVAVLAILGGAVLVEAIRAAVHMWVLSGADAYEDRIHLPYPPKPASGGRR